MSIAADAQTLSPTALIQLYTLDLSSIGAGFLRFHGHTNGAPIFWQGNEYTQWPVDATGFERTSEQPPTPTIMVGNIDGSISALMMFYQDLVSCSIYRMRTHAKYLDAINFPDGNPDADPTACYPVEKWIIAQKTKEDKVSVELKLTSGMDINGVTIPNRSIIANLCWWQYRDADCGYTGGPVADINDQPTSDPNLDRCSRRLTGCKLRFGATSELPFGGYPSAGLNRTS